MNDEIQTIRETISHLEGTPSEEQSFLRATADRLGLKNVAYLGLRLPRRSTTDPLILTTYSRSWIDHYRQQDYVLIDPVVTGSLNSILPIDWGQTRRNRPAVGRLFGEAREFGVGERGLTVPIRGRTGDVALFSVTADVQLSEWEAFKRACMSDLQMFGYCFHQHVLEKRGLEVPKYRLAPRETECLKWAAEGKTASETGDILSISERSVAFYLTLARAKLNCMNTTQAVAKALCLGLIPPPSL
jgi:DNA-binding CsgD family transcriptional regulator